MAEVIFGTQNINSSNIRLCEIAWNKGIRSYDTALAYNNLNHLNNFFKNLQDRSSYRIISKITKGHIEYEGVRKSILKILQKLNNQDYIDTLLIHAPKGVDHIKVLNELEELRQDGLIKKYGVSNYTIKHLRSLKNSNIKLDVLQNEIHPFLQESELVNYCNRENINVMAHSGYAHGLVFKNPRIKKVANLLNVTISELILSWHLSRKISPIFFSSDSNHIKNTDYSKISKISPQFFEDISGLNTNLRICDNPEWSEF